MNEIIQALYKLIKPLIKRQIIRCKVISVDTGEYTCEVETIEKGSKRFEVKLRTIADGEDTGFVLIPAMDSIVLVGIIDNNESDCFIAQYSELDSMHYKIEKSSLKSTNDGNWEWEAFQKIVFPNAVNGLVHIGNLVAQVNEMKGKINELVTFSATHTHPETGTTTGVPTSPVVGSLSTINNNTIKHTEINF